MRSPTAPALSALLVLLAACADRGRVPLATSVCDLDRHPQRLVQLDADVRLRSDGQAVLADASCAAERIELQLTGAAARTGLEATLKAALAGGAEQVRVPVTLTGVYAAQAGGIFTAETLALEPAAR